MSSATLKDAWLSAGAVYDQAPESIDADLGVIVGGSVITKGEALGHGFHIDDEMLDAVVRLTYERYSDTERGLKARFGHPNLSSTALGTFLGRWKNLRRDGDRVLGDFYGSQSARKTPDGDLLGYIMALADDDEKAFGVSTVLKIGQPYTRNEKGEKVLVESAYSLKDDQKLYYEIDGVIGADFVDDPAANPDGLFSAWHLSSFAGQMTRFLDTHPQIFGLVRERPEIIDEFLERYRLYLARGGLQQTYSCECIDCGYRQTSERHCAELKCPECGGQMRREERPGPGRNNRLSPGPDGAGAVSIPCVGSDDAGVSQLTKENDVDMKETMAALKKEFPDRAEFVLAQLEKGNDVDAAKAEFTALRLKELEAENAELKAKGAETEQALAAKEGELEKIETVKAEKAKRDAEIAGGGEGAGVPEPVGFQASAGDAGLEAEFMGHVRKLMSDRGISMQKAILAAAELHPELSDKLMGA